MYERLLARALASTSRSVLLLGPRQVGKSTLLAALRPDLTINLASPAAFRDYVSRPEQLEHELEAAPAATKTVFIDEVQRVPALLDVAQVFLDRRRGVPVSAASTRLPLSLKIENATFNFPGTIELEQTRFPARASRAARLVGGVRVGAGRPAPPRRRQGRKRPGLTVEALPRAAATAAATR